MTRLGAILLISFWAAFALAPVSGQAQQLYFEQQAKVTSDDIAVSDLFGWAAAVDGEVAVFGALGDNTRTGSAYVYRRSGTAWAQEQKLTASDGEPDDIFGVSVDVSGDHIFVGAAEDSPAGHNSGSAYIFHTTGTNWYEQKKIVPGDHEMDDKFGEGISADGDRAAVASRFDDDSFPNSGSVYVFVRDATDWVEEDKVVASEPLGNANFGSGLDLNGDSLIVGAPGGTGSAGRAFIYIRSASDWNEVDILDPSDGVAGDGFGRSVSIDGTVAAVGAPIAAPQGASSGAVYLFADEGSGWQETQKILAPGGDAGDQFGISVALRGDTLLVGADFAANPEPSSGAVYVYVRNGADWVFEAKWFVEDGAENQVLGRVVSLSGDTAVSGALGDLEAGFFTGAGYIFSRTATQIPGLEPSHHVEGWDRY